MSNIIRNAHYVRIQRLDGGYLAGMAFQDRYVGQTRNYQGVDYQFADMQWGGVASGSDGDSSELTGVARAAPQTFALAAYSLNQVLLAEVKVVRILDSGVGEPVEAVPPLLSVTRAIISSAHPTTTTVEFRIASPLLIGASGAGRRCQEQDLGALPLSGSFAL